MSPEEFASHQDQDYTRIPLVRPLLADLDTPLTTYLKMATGPYSYLFESFQGGEKWGRYSIVGLPCHEIIKIRGDVIEKHHNGNLTESFEHENPVEWLKSFHQSFHVMPVDALPQFAGGLVGYFAYDSVRYAEPRLGPCELNDPIGAPDILMMISDELIVFDNLTNKVYLVVNVDPNIENSYDKGMQRLDELHQQLIHREVSRQPFKSHKIHSEDDFVSNFGKQAYNKAINKIKNYILEGDVMQVVLSQRLSIPYDAPPTALYRALRHINPSPYLYYLNLQDFHIVGSSPEILVRVRDGEVVNRPLAGTRRRGATEAEDLALETELLADKKELAEHLMLIDLGRNDVGRISQTSSVEVTEKFAIERYSHVMHISSNVIGKIKPDLHPLDAMQATLPAGTLSGAPKIRAMEIIDELESEKRGIYGGAVGYLGYDGNMDAAIAIRTAVIKDNTLYMQAGGGIVADSNPDDEWEETLNKARAIIKALKMVEKGEV